MRMEGDGGKRGWQNSLERLWSEADHGLIADGMDGFFPSNRMGWWRRRSVVGKEEVI